MSQVRLVVAEEVGVPRTAEVLRCGVPFAAGALRDERRHQVAVDGTPVPSQVLWAARDGAGWVRWLGLAFPVSVAALGVADVTVAAADESTVSPPAASHPAGDPGASVTELPDGRVSISTGTVSATFMLEPFSCSGPRLGVESAQVWLVGSDGRRHCATVPSHGITVRHSGPLFAQVEFAGRYGSESWGFRARVTARAGSVAFDLDVGIVNDLDDPESAVSSWEVQLTTARVESGLCGLFDAAHRGLPPFTVQHRGGGHARGIFASSAVVEGSDWDPAHAPGSNDRWEWAELHGRLAGNWVIATPSAGLTPTTVSARRFAENHPGDLAVLPDGITVRFWPSDAGSLQLTQGAAKTRTLRIAAGEHTRTGPVLDSPLVAAVDADPSRIPAIDGVSYLPNLPERYPNLESHIRDELSGWYQSGQSLGFHDFGDSMQGITTGPRTGYSANNEHDALFALCLHYLRSGERVYYDSAEAYADHLCDIDLIQHTTVFEHEIGGLRAHGRAHVHYVQARTVAGPVQTSIDTGHLWTEGLVLFGQLSGEQRYLEAARQVGDCIVGLCDLGWTRPQPGPRNSGWPLIALTAVARATGEARYLDAAERTAKAAISAQHPDGRWLMRLGLVDDYCAWQNAVLLIGLSRLLALSDTPEVRTAFEVGSRALLDLGRNRDGTFVYLHRFDYRWANRPALVREALALAFDATGDDRYLHAGLAGGARWYRPRGSSPALSNDVAEWRGHLPFLARAHAAGVLQDLPDAG